MTGAPPRNVWKRFWPSMESSCLIGAPDCKIHFRSFGTNFKEDRWENGIAAREERSVLVQRMCGARLSRGICWEFEKSPRGRAMVMNKARTLSGEKLPENS